MGSALALTMRERANAGCAGRGVIRTHAAATSSTYAISAGAVSAALISRRSSVRLSALLRASNSLRGIMNHWHQQLAPSPPPVMVFSTSDQGTAVAASTRIVGMLHRTNVFPQF